MQDEKPTLQAGERFPLDDVTIQMIQELDAEGRQLQSRAAALDGSLRTALVLFLRRHDLKGNWDLADSRRELVLKEVAPVPAATDVK